MTEITNQAVYAEAVVAALVEAGHEPEEVTVLDLLDVLATSSLRLTPDPDGIALSAYQSSIAEIAETLT